MNTLLDIRLLDGNKPVYSENEILAFIKAGIKFEADGEVDLIKLGWHDVIMIYIQKNFLCGYAQTALIERGNHEEIMAYIQNHNLNKVAQRALIKRGNHEEMLPLISNEKLSPAMAEAIIKRGYREEVVAFIQYEIKHSNSLLSALFETFPELLETLQNKKS